MVGSGGRWLCCWEKVMLGVEGLMGVTGRLWVRYQRRTGGC